MANGLACILLVTMKDSKLNYSLEALISHHHYPLLAVSQS